MRRGECGGYPRNVIDAEDGDGGILVLSGAGVGVRRGRKVGGEWRGAEGIGIMIRAGACRGRVRVRTRTRTSRMIM